MICKNYVKFKFGSVNSFVGTQPHLFIYKLPVVAFVLQWQTWVVATEGVCHALITLHCCSTDHSDAIT